MTGPQDSTGSPPKATGPRGAGRSGPPTPIARRSAPGWRDYLKDPRTAVLLFLTSALVLGGGRKALLAIRARRVVAAISGANPDVLDVEAAAEQGRAGLIELFRLLGTAASPEVRAASGRALARLWHLDELIAEEEKAIVRRGYAADWRARRTYPRALAVPIAITVDFGVPFLRWNRGEVAPDNLHWSYRVLGTERAGLEAWSEPRSGSPSASFAIIPDDFATLGPHRLTLQTRVKTVGLTDSWELELPHLPFTFEFDPHLGVDALLTLPDDTRAAQFAAAVRLETSMGADQGTSRLVALTTDLVLRDPPTLTIQSPLPCDLAHRLTLEIEGIPGSFEAGSVVVVAADLAATEPLAIPIGPIEGFPPGALDRPGTHRLRAVLTADPNLGWVNPSIRSIWPGAITTDWVETRIIRR